MTFDINCLEGRQLDRIMAFCAVVWLGIGLGIIEYELSFIPDGRDYLQSAMPQWKWSYHYCSGNWITSFFGIEADINCSKRFDHSASLLFK